MGEKDDDQELDDEKDLLRWAERTQRNIDFIAQQHAQFSADMQRMRESQERNQQDWEQRWHLADARWTRTEEGIRALLAIAEIHEQEINTIKEAQDRTDRQMAETDRKMAETDERINALINVVERHITEGRNGGREA